MEKRDLKEIDPEVNPLQSKGGLRSKVLKPLTLPVSCGA